MLATEETIRQFIDGVSMDVEVLTNYSGRGMYGAECLAIVVRNSDTDAQSLGDILNAVYFMGTETDDNDVLSGKANRIGEVLRSAQIGTLGSDTVIYFPAAQTKDRHGVAS